MFFGVILLNFVLNPIQNVPKALAERKAAKGLIIKIANELDQNEQLKKGISAIDLGNCIEQIKDYYNMPKSENLIILNSHAAFHLKRKL